MDATRARPVAGAFCSADALIPVPQATCAVPSTDWTVRQRHQVRGVLRQSPLAQVGEAELACRVHCGARPQQQTLGLQDVVDHAEHVGSQVVHLEQKASPAKACRNTTFVFVFRQQNQTDAIPVSLDWPTHK